MSWSSLKLEVRMALASVSVLLLSVAWAWQALDPAAGHCLQGGSGAFHCPLCWAAAALALLAMAPYPRRTRLTA
ncbi:MAG: hypothetical protein K1X35_06185 [Caulobacteraceae bacterium]|nr:hypothetical protein [Caulobacteraceae bacterium]